MTITYTWNFNPIETAILEDGLTDVVKTVHWQLRGVDNKTGTTHQVIGSETLPSADPSDFIEFESLTEELVKTWVLTQMSKQQDATPEEAEEQLKQSIAQQIELIDHPKIVKKSAPWAV